MISSPEATFLPTLPPSSPSFPRTKRPCPPSGQHSFSRLSSLVVSVCLGRVERGEVSISCGALASSQPVQPPSLGLCNPGKNRQLCQAFPPPSQCSVSWDRKALPCCLSVCARTCVCACVCMCTCMQSFCRAVVTVNGLKPEPSQDAPPQVTPQLCPSLQHCAPLRFTPHCDLPVLSLPALE